MVKKATSKKLSASPTLSKKKTKAVAIDGFGSVEQMKLRNAIRQVWQRSKQWGIVKARCKNDDGYFVCEERNTQVPKISVDHIVPIGDMLEPGFLERLMVPSSELQGLCDPCHKPKTKKDNATTKAKKEKRNYVVIEEESTPEMISAMWIDPDIEELDIWTKDKIALQKERNAARLSTPTLEQFI